MSLKQNLSINQRILYKHNIIVEYDYIWTIVVRCSLPITTLTHSMLSLTSWGS